jgi:hypothetical protein
MAQHRSITLPPADVVRGIYLAAVARENAVVWQTAAAEIVESRETWPGGTAGLTTTPADPAALGWTRLTPAP